MESDGPFPFGPPDPPKRSYGLVITVVVCFTAVAIAYLLASPRVAEAPPLPRLPPVARPSAPAAGPSAPAAGLSAPAAGLSVQRELPMPPPPEVRRGTPVPPAIAEPPVVAATPRSPTTTIYLCRDYAGGLFWSDTICHQQRATIDRMTSVPSDLPFAEQAAIAQGKANEAAALYVAPQAAPAAAIAPRYPRTGR